MFDLKTYLPYWFAPIIMLFLILGAGFGNRALAVGVNRSDPFLIINQISNLMPQAQAEAWQEAASQIERPDRLGPILLEWISHTDSRLANLLTSSEETKVPNWLTDKDSLYNEVAPSFRLAIAEKLFLLEQYDACLVWCDGLEDLPVYSSDLLGYLRTVSAYMTVDYKTAKDSLLLLTDSDENFGLARRKTLEQVRHSLKEDEPEKLNVVAHRMEDVERRLALGQGSQPTQDQQQRVIDDLDELIKKLEEQQKQQQASSSNAAPSGTPAEESRAGEYKGPGQVDRKRFSSGDPWGALSPAERERLSQGIDRDFPGHYRRLIEGYYQRLADADREGTDQPNQSTPKQGSER